MNKTFTSLTLLMGMYAANVFAQAQVIDPRPVPGAGSVQQLAAQNNTDAQPVSQASLPTDFYYQLQLLQQEVLQLRGMVDEQAHAIKKLKQQRLDDYLDLDRRLSKLTNGATAGSTGSSSNDSNNAATQRAEASSSVSSAQAETQSYRSAIDLVLRKKNYKAATNALINHLKEFPEGSTAANAHYWLGELYLKDDKLDVAQKWFSDLLVKYPTHSKMPDSKYKLGQVLFLQGKKEQSRTVLDEVVSLGGSAGNLARRFIAKNF